MNSTALIFMVVTNSLIIGITVYLFVKIIRKKKS